MTAGPDVDSAFAVESSKELSANLRPAAIVGLCATVFYAVGSLIHRWPARPDLLPYLLQLVPLLVVVWLTGRLRPPSDSRWIAFGADLGFTGALASHLLVPSTTVFGSAITLSLKMVATALLLPWSVHLQFLSVSMTLLCYWGMLALSGRAIASEVTLPAFAGPVIAALISVAGAARGYRMRRELFEYAATLSESEKQMHAIKRAEAALVSERNKLNNILQVMPEGVCIVGPQLDVEFANPVFQHEFGPLRYGKCFEYLHERQEPCPWCVNAEELAGKSVRLEWTSDKTGKTYDLLATSLVNADGSISKLEMFHDITESKRAEAALAAEAQRGRELLAQAEKGRRALLSVLEDQRRAEEAIRRERDFSDAALNSLPGIFYVNEGRRLLRWNQNAERITGYTGAEIARMSPLDFVAEEDRELVRTRIEEVFAKGASHVEAHLVAKDGTRTPYYLTGLATRIDDKLCLIGTGIDITERKRAAEERERLATTLRRSQALSAVGALVAGVAHEARNPLFGISATLDAFEARFGQQPEFAQYLTVLREEVKHLNDLMRDLLDYGRAPNPIFVPGSITTVIGEAVSACAPLAREAAVRVIATTAEGIVPVSMDTARLPQVFQNLIQNAIQHSPRGGTVTVETGEVRDDSTAWVECTVKDAGPGFQEDDLPRRLFEPFFSRRHGGTGLGLSIVDRIVEDHHGTVSAANRPEGGAVVTVRLPIADGPRC